MIEIQFSENLIKLGEKNPKIKKLLRELETYSRICPKIDEKVPLDRCKICDYGNLAECNYPGELVELKNRQNNPDYVYCLLCGHYHKKERSVKLVNVALPIAEQVKYFCTKRCKKAYQGEKRI